MEVPHELKSIVPYLKKAEEVQQREPLIAYYCKYYAVKLGITVHTQDAQKYLAAMVDYLEQMKHSIANFDEEVAKTKILNLGLRIFVFADNEDRAGNASLKTAKNFYTAAIFLEVLSVFDELSIEVAEKIKYAKWKATDITKCIKQGIAPQPGPPVDTALEAELDEIIKKNAESSTPQTSSTFDSAPANDTFSLNPPPLNVSIPISPTATTNYANIESYSTKKSVQSNELDMGLPADYVQLSQGKAIDQNRVNAAQKATKFALSSLQFDDIPAALRFLKEAIKLLE